jgi:hypothetical protein
MLWLMYPSRTRVALSVLKTNNEPCAARLTVCKPSRDSLPEQLALRDAVLLVEGRDTK